jgi:hypothetical protein
MAFVGEEIEPKLTQQVGGNAPMETDDPLVVLLYVLLRDHITAGVFERLVAEMVAAPVSLTNAYLGGLAANIADRLRLLMPPPAGGFVLTTDEREALSDVISVASSTGASYEVYGGVEVKTAVQLATGALDRMDQELPLPVDVNSEAEKVRMQLADLLTQARTTLLQRIAISTEDKVREALMGADEELEKVFEAFAPERWKQELEEWEKKNA